MPDAKSGTWTLIASLPNPTSHGSASLFEPALEGVVSAIADEGWLLDRSWLWDPVLSDDELAEGDDASGATDAPTAPTSSKEARKAATKGSTGAKDASASNKPESSKKDAASPSSAKCSEVIPGVILFRREKAWLTFFVVGESSVWGLDQEALKWAVGNIRRRKKGPSISLVGPYFSGSAESFASALHHFRWSHSPGVVSIA